MLVKELCRKHGFSDASFYTWRAKHKRVYRLYLAAGLAVRRRRRRYGVMIEREQRALPNAPNEV